MKRLLLLTVLLIPLTSFSVLADEPELYSVSNENTPAIGEALTRYLGDKMTLQRTGKYLPCYISKSDLEWSAWGSSLKEKISKGDYFCKEKLDGKYLGFKPNVFHAGRGHIHPLLLKSKKKTTSVCLSGCSKKISNAEFKNYFEQAEMLVIEDNSFQQSIEYSGKSGSVLTFTYSEYMELKSKVNQYGVRSYPEKIARDAFTREFKVDLNDSSVGGFKGAIFEVISVDNVQIEYKMVRHFQ
jgi:hypothetical protein|tara:strand:- start:528 stop:1250 length:723 start_codon:yes stop_codon:yes gene_type:complete